MKGRPARARRPHGCRAAESSVGQRLRELLDLPDELLRDKTETVDGKEQAVPFVRPNYSLADGSKVNYRQHLLRWEPYLGTTGVAAFDPARFAPTATQPEACEVTATVHDSQDGPAEGQYGPSACMVRKGNYLRFAVRNLVPWLKGTTVTFAMENHGKEAEKAPNGNNGNHSTTATLGVGHDAAVRREPTAYRGLHYMTITVTSPSVPRPVFQQRNGVYLE